MAHRSKTRIASAGMLSVALSVSALGGTALAASNASSPAGVAASDSASVSARRFLNCGSMRRVHPNGIAVSPGAAKLAVRNGFKRPDVRPVTYAQSPDSLDRRNRGVMCTVKS